MDIETLSACTMPVLLSGGTQSPPWFSAILNRLTAAMPQARRQLFEGAGHIPHVTHPQQYATALTTFTAA